MKIEVCLIGTSPLLMHNPRMVDPEYELNRDIKAITAKRKKTDEDLHQIERLEWFGGLYEENGVIVQPSSKVRKCLVEAARARKLGKAVEKAITFNVLNVPLIHEGPKKIDDLYKEKQFHSRLSVGLHGKRVMRIRPQFFPWKMAVPGMFVEDVGLNYDELDEVVQSAGITIGIGDNRVNGYGRFAGTLREVK